MAKVTGSRASNFPNGVRTDRDMYVGPVVFASTSAAATGYLSVPFKCEIVEIQFIQAASLAAVPGAWTLKIGSAGTTIGTITPASAGVAGQLTQQTTITAGAVAAAEAISITRTTSGTGYVGNVSVIVKRVD